MVSTELPQVHRARTLILIQESEKHKIVSKPLTSVKTINFITLTLKANKNIPPPSLPNTSLSKLLQLRGLCPAHTFMVKNLSLGTAGTLLSCSLGHVAEKDLVEITTSRNATGQSSSLLLASKTPSQIFTAISVVASLKTLFMSGKKRRKGVKNQNPRGNHWTQRQHRRHRCWWNQEETDTLVSSDAHDTEGSREHSSDKVSIQWPVVAVSKND